MSGKDKTPDKTAEAVSMVPQAHGGALKRGGNNGGGRPTSKFRAALRKAAEQRLPDLKKIAAGKMKDATVADRLRAIDMMIRYGMGPGISLDDVREKLKATVVMAESMLDEETADKFVSNLRTIWLGEH